MALSSLKDLLEAHRHKEKELFSYLQLVYTDTSKRQPSYPVLTEDHSLRPATTRPSIRYTRDLGSKELTHGDPTTLRQARREKGRERDRDRGWYSEERGAEGRERNQVVELTDEKEKERSQCRSSLRPSGFIPHHTVGCLEDQSIVNRLSHRTSSSPRRREVSIPQPKIPTRRKSFKSRIARKHETVKMIRKILEEHSPDNFKYADRMLRDYLGREEDLLEKLLQDFGLTDERDTAMERERERDLLTSYDESLRIQSNDSSESDDDIAYKPPHKTFNGFSQSAVVSTSGSTQPTTTINRADEKFKGVPSLCHSTGSAPAVGSDQSSGSVRNRDGDRDCQKPRATSLNLPAAKKIFLVPRPLRAKSLTSSNTTSPALDLPVRILAPVAYSSSHTLSTQSRIPPAHKEPAPVREREGWTHEVPIELPSPLGRYPHNSAPSEVPPHPSPMGPGGTFSFNRTSSTSPSRLPSYPMPPTTKTEKKLWSDSKCRISGDAWTADVYMEQDILFDEHLDQDRDRGRIKESPKWSIGASDSNKSRGPGTELTLDVVLVPVKVQTSALSRLFQEASPTTSPAESPLLTSVHVRGNPFLEAADDMVDRAGRPLGASGESYSVNTITLHLPPRKAALTHTRSATQMIAPSPLLPTPSSLQRLEHSDPLLPSEASAAEPPPLPVHFSLPPPPPIRSLLLGKSKAISPSSCHDMGCGDRSASQSPPLPLHFSLPPPPPIRYSTLGKSKVTSYSSCYDINRGDRSEESDGSMRYRCAGEVAGGRSVPAVSDCSSISTTTTPLSPCSPTQ